MADKAESKSKEELVAAYKEILQSYIDLRPSGVRLKIADAIGKHKSFVLFIFLWFINYFLCASVVSLFFVSS